MSIISALTDTARETFEVLSVPDNAVHERINTVEAGVKTMDWLVSSFFKPTEEKTKAKDLLFTTEYSQALENHLRSTAIRPDLLEPSILKEVKPVPHTRTILDGEVSVITENQLMQMAAPEETVAPEFQPADFTTNGGVSSPADQEAELQAMIDGHYANDIARLEALANNAAMTMDQANAYITQTAQQY